MITYPSKSELKTATEVAVYFRNSPSGNLMWMRSFYVTQFAGTGAHCAKTPRSCLAKATKFANSEQAKRPTYDFLIFAE